MMIMMMEAWKIIMSTHLSKGAKHYHQMEKRGRERQSLMIYFPLNYFRIFHTYENYIILVILSERDGEKRLSKMSGENV